MNMREIQVLSEIANYCSFTDAAYSLSYSPSVISKYVISVEEELGLKIFVRGNKSSKLALTPEGQLLIHDIQRINSVYQHMMELTQQLKGTFDNVLRVGSQARFGNVVEREIIASFLIENPTADIEQMKMSFKDLQKLFQAGKLDALFVSVPENSNIDDYYTDMDDHLDIEITLLTSEREIYLGISDKYLLGIEHEAKFSEFKDFSFAFAFPMSADDKDSRAIETFRLLARKNSFNLKTTYFGAHDTSILKLATRMPIAVATTNVPARFEGIKFIRVVDWDSYTNVYFVCLRNNGKKILHSFKKSIENYLKQQE
jgi:molybdenum-dependent DNA-binding transcriptional regulator ModE